MRIKRIIFLIILSLFFKISISQNLKNFILLSEIDGSNVEFAHVFKNNKLTTYSKENGRFNIDISEPLDSLKISHLEFKTKKLSFQDLIKRDTIYLQENSTVLNEVFIDKTKKETKKLLPKKSIKGIGYGKSDLPFPYGFKIAVYVPNEENITDFYIKKILLKSKKTKPKVNSKFIPFKINLMTLDTITNLPDKNIFDEDLVVGKLENQPLVEVNIEKIKEVSFPKNGIFVVVSVYEEDYYLKNGFTSKPNFGITRLRKKSKFRQLNFYLVEGVYKWWEPFYSKEKIQSFNFGIEIHN